MKCILNLAAGVMVLMMPRLAVEARAQEEGLPEGVTAKVVTYYSEHVACYGRIFFPKDFVPGGKTPGVVLANGWAGTAVEAIGKISNLKALGNWWTTNQGFISQLSEDDFATVNDAKDAKKAILESNQA